MHKLLSFSSCILLAAGLACFAGCDQGASPNGGTVGGETGGDAIASQTPSAPPAPPEPATTTTAGGGSEGHSATGAPVVVSSIPAAGAADVDPALKEIAVVFDQPMAPGQWSWDFGQDRSMFPDVSGSPRYLADGRTCVLPVNLKAGRSYELVVNSSPSGDFKSASGLAAKTFRLTFRVGEGDSSAAGAAAVVRSSPQNGSRSVNPGLREISVTFDRAMKANSWSWNFGPDRTKFPKIAGQPRYLPDQATCVLPVSLEAGKEYELHLNSPDGGKFVDLEGTAAEHFVLTFATAEN